MKADPILVFTGCLEEYDFIVWYDAFCGSTEAAGFEKQSTRLIMDSLKMNV